MAETISVRCPECERKLRVPESAVGKKVRCPGCKEIVRLSAESKKSAPKDQTPDLVAAAATPKAEKKTETAAPKPEPQVTKAEPKPTKAEPVKVQEKETSEPEEPPAPVSQKTAPSKNDAVKTSNFENRPQQITLPKIESGSKIKSVNPAEISLSHGGTEKRINRSPKVRPRRSNPWPSFLMALFAMAVLVISVVVISFLDQSRNEVAEKPPEFRVPEKITAVAGIPLVYFVDRTSLQSLSASEKKNWSIDIGTITDGEKDITEDFEYDRSSGQLRWNTPKDFSGKTLQVQFLLNRKNEIFQQVKKPLEINNGKLGQQQLVKLVDQLKQSGSEVTIYGSEVHSGLPGPLHDVLVDDKKFRFLVFDSSGDAARAQKMNPPLVENPVVTDGFPGSMADAHYNSSTQWNALMLFADGVDFSETPALISVFDSQGDSDGQSEKMEENQDSSDTEMAEDSEE